MKILIACEESQAVCKEFRALGHEAFSCDIQECSGGHPEWHIQGDVFKVINDNWDMMVAFPPCTYLTFAGIRWFNESKYGIKAAERKEKRDEALKFVMELYNAPIPFIAIENPRGFLMNLMKPTQIIHPYYFGDTVKKSTCLWLKNLPKLVWIKESDLFNKKTIGNLEHKYFYAKDNKKGKPISWSDCFSPNVDRAKLRSKTFPGIAKAMAQQWSAFLKETAVSKTAVTET